MLTVPTARTAFKSGKHYTYEFTPGDRLLDLSGSCLDPCYVHFRNPVARNQEWDVWYSEGTHLHLTDRRSNSVEVVRVRCRQCPKCIHVTKMQWVERAMLETQAAKGTFLCTMTFSEQWFRRSWREVYGHELSSTWDEQPGSEEHGNRAETRRWLLSEFTLWCKRVRELGFAFRYMGVVEYGSKRGRLHFHFLYHDYSGRDVNELTALLKRQAEHFPNCTCKENENCRVGWLDLEAIEGEGAIHYVAKYMRKQWDNDAGGITVERCRVRASLKYGAM